MKIVIHRGIDQIGGCITEIATANTKVIIDLGSNLPGCQGEEFTRQDIERITAGADAIYYTHFHGDHVGLSGYVHDNVGYRNKNPKVVAAFEMHRIVEKWGDGHLFSNNVWHILNNKSITFLFSQNCLFVIRITLINSIDGG